MTAAHGLIFASESKRKGERAVCLCSIQQTEGKLMLMQVQCELMILFSSTKGFVNSKVILCVNSMFFGCFVFPSRNLETVSHFYLELTISIDKKLGKRLGQMLGISSVFLFT